MKVRRTRQRPSGFRCRKENPAGNRRGESKRDTKEAPSKGERRAILRHPSKTMKSPASGGKAGGAGRGVTAP
jgi:hypothetical protein